MATDRMIFERGEYAAKLDAGPTPPKPGPTLFMHVATAVKFVSKSNDSKLTARKHAPKTNR